MLLKGSGYEVDTACEPAEALEKLRSPAGRYSLLIADDNMPGLRGAEMVRQMRGGSSFGGKVIILSGTDAAELQKAYSGLGISRFFQKPIDIPALLGGIEALQADLAIERLSGAQTRAHG
jgi:CheY-like chemotaxis protein